MEDWTLENQLEVKVNFQIKESIIEVNIVKGLSLMFLKIQIKINKIIQIC